MDRHGVLFGVLMALFLPLCVGTRAQPIQPDMAECLRVAGAAQAVKWFAEDLNNALCAVARRNGVEPIGATMVVPVIDAKTGRALGGAQIAGPAESLASARAVFSSQTNGMTHFTVVTGTAAGATPVGREVGVCGLISFETGQ